MMKERNRKLRKTLMIICCALVLVAISVGTTLAYLTDTEAVTNVFTVGKVGITLNEAKVGADGKALTGDAAERVNTNSYHLIPGQAYDKDPMVTIDAESELAYVRMMVKVTDYGDLVNILQKEFGSYANFIGGNHQYIDAKKPVGGEYAVPYVKLEAFANIDSSWTLTAWYRDETADTAVYEYRYNSMTEKKEDEYDLTPLFKAFTLPGWMDNTDLAALGKEYELVKTDDDRRDPKYELRSSSDDIGFSIDIEAHAIQATGFDSADKAWEAFDEQMKN